MPFQADRHKALRLVAITDHRQFPLTEQLITALIQGGISALMLREKYLSDAALIKLGREPRRLCREAGVAFMVNHSPQAALELKADALHLGQKGPSPEQARALLGDSLPIGFSVHNPRELQRALEAGAAYVTLSPVFPPHSKAPQSPPLGLKGLAQLVNACPLPAVALGGIDASNAAACLASGVVGVACIGALFKGDPQNNAATLRSRLKTSDF